MQRKRSVLHWVWGAIILAALTYLTAPSQVVSRGGMQTSASSQSSDTVKQGAISQTPESAAPLSSPRPLNKEAIPLAVKRIVIDPGHGGEPGAMSDSGVTEKDITLDVALRLRRLMENEPVEVLLTRQTDQFVPLDKRVAFANENKADLFVSIHVNSVEPRSLRVLETYYVGPSDDPATLKLASLENKDSGYSLSDYKKILEKIYVDARHDESRILAKTIQAQLYHSLKPANPVLLNRGVKTAPFVVLIGTQMPAILVEISCLSNEDEVTLLTKAHYRENIALALLQGIRNYASNFNAPQRKGS
jgi:N-acetylmuramoyl-L-alanine amidase